MPRASLAGRENTPRSAAEIESDIRRTRAELSFTLDALAYQVAPRRLIEKGIDMISQPIKNNGVVWIDLGEAVRANRIPLALIGVGVAWLLAANLGTGRGEAADDLGSSEEGISPTVAGGMSRNGVWMHQATGAARSAARSVRDTAGTVLERAGEYAGYAGSAGEQVRRAGESVRAKVEQHPLLIGLAGLICGAAIAALLPSSKREQDWLNATRGELWEKAEQIGHEAADRVRSLSEPDAGVLDR
jgi:Protein of unknown function (DUF3618)